MNEKGGLSDYGGAVLLACLVAAIVFAYAVIKPFITIFLLAAVLAILARPVHLWLLKMLKGREWIASLLTVLAVVLFVIVPLVVLLSLLAQESLTAYDWVNNKVQSGFLTEKALPYLSSLQQKYLPDLKVDLNSIGKSVAGMAGKVSNFMIHMAGGVLSTLGSAVWQFFLMLFALYYFLKDGGKILRWFMHLVPLPQSLEEEIVGCFQDVSRSAFYGTFLTAVAQGALGGIGFWIAGLPPLVWGFVMAFFSMVPMVGTVIIWLPAALLLLASGKTWQGVFLIAWGAVVVGMSDNLLRPFLMKGKNELHPSIIFFAILGGLSAFGVLGILLGPLAIVLLLALLKAYEEAARPVLEELDSK